MSELKPCPFCGGEATMKAPNMHRKTCIACKECGVSTGWGTVEEVTAAWNRRAQPTNEPLTMEQLREMGYEWVWVERIGNGELPKSVLKYINGYGYVLAKHQKVKICDICLFFDDYGKTWLAYRQKPEGSDRDGQTI